MKKVLCLLLTICLLPISALVLSACGEKDRELKNFYTAYTQIADNNEYLTLNPINDDYGLNIQADKIEINYAKNAELSALVENSSKQYKQIKYFYQKVLDNTLSPMYFYGKSLSQHKKLSKKQVEKLYARLDDLADGYSSINYYCGILISSLKSTTDDDINYTYLRKLFAEFENTIEQASLLSRLVSDIYFNQVLKNSNLNYGTKGSYEELTDADLSAIADSIKKRVYYYKSVYANVFNELYINQNDLGEKITSGLNVDTLTYAPYNYIANIESLSTKSPEALRANKQAIYSNIVSLYQIQLQIDEDYEQFEQSKQKVVYAKLSSTSSAEDKNHGTAVDHFAYGIAMDSYQVLKQLITVLYN